MNNTMCTKTGEIDDQDGANLPQPSVNSPKRRSAPSQQTSNSRTGKKHKSNTSDEVKDTLKDVANAVKMLVERINTPLHILISQIIEVVGSLPLIPEHMEMPVIDFLVSDEKKALTFLSLKNEKKMKWLKHNFDLGSSSRSP